MEKSGKEEGMEGMVVILQKVGEQPRAEFPPFALYHGAAVWRGFLSTTNRCPHPYETAEKAKTYRQIYSLAHRLGVRMLLNVLSTSKSFGYLLLDGVCIGVTFPLEQWWPHTSEDSCDPP